VASPLAELAAALVAIDSVNPALVSGGAGEREIASFAADWCMAQGFEVEVLGDERPSVVATKRGSGGGRSLLLNGHLDTVGVAGMEAPFEPRIEGDRLYGRGAYDMKGALAAILLAASDATGLRGDLIVTLVADEELASIGTEAVVESARAVLRSSPSRPSYEWRSPIEASSASSSRSRASPRTARGRISVWTQSRTWGRFWSPS
jgi:acetylornithine deacetylase